MTKTNQIFRNSLISIASVLLFSGIAMGQVASITNLTQTPTPGTGHDYIGMLSETVNPASGSVSLRMQVPTPPGRGISLPFSFAYDSGSVNHMENSSPGLASFVTNRRLMAMGGWHYSVPILNVSIAHRVNKVQVPPVTYSCEYDTNYIFEDPSGGLHSLRLSPAGGNVGGNNDCQHVPDEPVAYLDGGDSSYRAHSQSFAMVGSIPAASVADASGTVYSFPNISNYNFVYNGVTSALASSIEDRNGNQLTLTPGVSPEGQFTVTDTLNRTVLSSSGFGTTGNTVSISGFGSYTVQWGTVTYGFSPGYTASNLISYYDPPLGGVNCCRALFTPGGTMPVITQITLPNGQSYQFQYDTTYGLLKKVIYPTGGYVRYVWQLNPLSQDIMFEDLDDEYPGEDGCRYRYDTPVVSQRWVSFDGQNEVLEQQFTYAPTNWDPNNFEQWLGYKQTTVQTTDLTPGGQTTTTIDQYGSYFEPSQPNAMSQTPNQIAVENLVTYQDGTGTRRTDAKGWQDQFLMTGETVTDDGVVTSKKAFTYQQADPNGPVMQMAQALRCNGSQDCSTQWTTKTAYAYDNIAQTPIYPYGISIVDRLSSVIVYDGGGSPAAKTDYTYDSGYLTGTSSLPNHDYTNFSTSYTSRGNATSMSKWVSTTGGWLPWEYTYDDTGQVLTMTDPNQNTTQYSYGDDNAYLTAITYPSTNGVAHTVSYTYNLADGHLASSTDQNSKVTSYFYGQNGDQLDRLTGINYPDCVLQGVCNSTTHSVSYSYVDSPSGPPSVTKTALLQSGQAKVSKSITDGLGNITQTQTTDPPGMDYIASTYDGLGRVRTVSNPYRSTSDPTYGLTTYTYDLLGRVTSTLYPGNSSATASYTGSTSTVTDAANKTRIMVSDALGRLTSVTEDPSGLNYSTSYAYNALDDLTTVTQGSQTRTFAYDSLSRLTSASNPESSTTSYTYPTPSALCSGDPSAVCTRTDARSITTIYAYDALNRLTSKSYSDGTPAANFAYDEASVSLGSWTSPTLFNYKGRLTHTTTTSGGTTLAATVQDYDPMGRTQDYWQCTVYNCSSASIWAMPFTYDLAGDITSWTHPVGFTVTNTISNAMRITQISSNLVDSTHPANFAQNITYTPWGALSSLTNGCAGSGCSNTLETYSYNTRLETSQIQLGTTGNPAAYYTLGYNYALPGGTTPPGCPVAAAGTGNNGNVIGYTYTDAVNSTLSHSALFVYDGVNRLACAQATGNGTYNLTYGYNQDGSGQYGNATCVYNSYTNGPCPSSPYTFNPATNRITTSGYSYDAAGNLLNDGTYGYTWDAEGRMKTLTGSGLSDTNTYNALGQRVTSTTLGYTSHLVYDPAGQWVGDYNSTGGYWWGQYIRLAGRVVAFNSQGTNNTVFLHKDVENTTHMATGPSGSILQDQTFYPWGQSWHNLGTWYQQEFAGLDYNDPANGLYTSLSRTYNPTPNRWLSPDPAGLRAVRLDDPQTWNAYAYTRNNPTTLTDPYGESWFTDFFQAFANCFRLGSCHTTPVALDKIQQMRTDLENWGARFNGKVPDYNHLSPRQISSYWHQFNNAARAFQQQQADQASNPAFLRFLHGRETLEQNSNINKIRNTPTQQIVDSLKPGPGNPDALKVKPDGTVMDGNTRLRVLEERGYDINKLPKEIYESDPIGPSLKEEIEEIGEEPIE